MKSILFSALFFSTCFLLCSSLEMTQIKVCIEQNDIPQAEKLLTAQLKKNPADAQACFLLGKIYADIQKWSLMDSLFLKAVSLKGTYYNKVESIRNEKYKSQFNAGIYNLNTNNFAKADSLFRNAIIIQSKRMEAFRDLAIIYSKTNKPEMARKILEQAILIDKNNCNIINDLVCIYYEQEDYLSIIKLNESFPFLPPLNTPSLMYVAVSYEKFGDNKKAINLCKKALRKKPDNVKILFYLGYLYHLENNNEYAIQQYLKILEQNPNRLDVLLNIAEAFFTLGDQALVDLHNEKSQDSKYDEKGYIQYFEQAVYYYKKAICIENCNLELWLKLSDSYRKSGNLILAEQCKNITKDISSSKINSAVEFLRKACF